MSATIKRVNLELGRVVATPAAIEALQRAGQSPLSFLRRHQCGDWGDVCPEDGALNDNAVETGDRILSIYRTSEGVKIWITTESDRSSTTLFLPEEY